MTSAPPVAAAAAPEPRRGGKQEQVREELLRLIASLRPGEPLPAERDLAARLGVARMTLRRAIDTLVAERRLIRRTGAGTFVAPQRVDQRLSATSFSEDMRFRGLVPGAHTVWARHVAANMMLASVLHVPPNTPLLHVRRVRTADGEPMALEDLHVPAHLVPGLTGAELEDASFYDLLARRYGRHITAATQTVEAYQVTAEEAGYLEIAPGASAFLFERTSRDDEGAVAEFVRSLYRGDRYRIVVDIYPTTHAGTDR